MILAKEFYLLRAPFLPLNFLEQFEELNHAELNDKLKEIFMDFMLQEAIYIASPELFQEFQKWQQGSLKEKKEVDKLISSLFRYLLRMCTRCTPYGLFAGCSLGDFSTTSQITIGHSTQHRKHSRLDMNYVAELVAMINQIPEVREQLYYYPNNSLYKMANKYRYAEYTIINKYRSYGLTAINCSEYLDKIINDARKGATLTELANNIVSDEITKEEAKEFILELVQHQILVSELEPTVTGEEFFIRLIKILQTLENTETVTEILIRIHNLMQGQRSGTRRYLQTHALVKQLLPDSNCKDLVQTDLFLATQHNTINKAVIKDIQFHLEKLLCLAHLTSNPDLQNFRQAFNERYGEQEVSLLIALDAESGVGYAGYSGDQADHTPLINDIIANKANPSNTISWSKMHDFQLKRLHQCLLDNSVEIELTDTDLDELKYFDTPVLPNSLYLIGSILGKSAEAVDAGDFQFELKICGGPSAGTLLGRFCHGDERLLTKVKECLQEEEKFNRDFIYAEIVHLPEARTGNILLRPQLRDYEIVYLGNGSVGRNNQILLTDLMVSVRDNTIILRSNKLNKRIIPRLSSAHNFISGSLPVYKFLCDLQFQQMHCAIGWHWNIENHASFLPRVRYGKIILSKCTWVLNKKDYPELLKDKGKSAHKAYYGLMKSIQQYLRIPQYVVIVEGDNELLINMNNESCVNILIDTLFKKERVVLQEFLNTIDRCFVEGINGKHTNEIIVPLTRIADTKQQGANNSKPKSHGEVAMQNGDLIAQKTTDVKRSFITGSEWLYVKIYCGTHSAERILKEVIRPLTKDLTEANTIDKWFFIRYADPEAHIRIRFHNERDEMFWKVILERLYAVMKGEINNALVHKIQTDTYEREIERYGVDTIELSEDIFYHDSEAVISCIDLLQGEEGEKYRWLLAARGIDMLLDDFDYSLQLKVALLKKMQQAFFSEFNGNKNLNKQLNDKYRENMQLISSFLNNKEDAENEIEEAVAIFAARSIRIRKIVSNIKLLRSDNEINQGFDELLPHYMHMFLNRILLSNQRKHELVIYHFLSKYYDSQIAKQKYRSQNAVSNNIYTSEMHHG
jgi:thiopeptide-type bacteriocin biosynthesis protein